MTMFMDNFATSDHSASKKQGGLLGSTLTHINDLKNWSVSIQVFMQAQVKVGKSQQS